MTEKDRGAVRSLTKRNLLWTLMGHGPQTCLNLSYRHWSVVAPHCPERDPWDWMHVANSGCRVYPDSRAHWHVSALLPIRKLCSSPHRQCRHRRHPRRIRFQANAGGNEDGKEAGRLTFPVSPSLQKMSDARKDLFLERNGSRQVRILIGLPAQRECHGAHIAQ